MEIERLSEAWLFQRHPKEQVRRWINQLEYSYFIRAWGGHANDDDHFELNLHFGSRNELLEIFQKIGIALKLIPEGHPRPVPGRSYTFDDWENFRWPMHDFPEYEQPRRIEINGIPCYCSVYKGVVSFTFTGQDGERYEVSETDFVNCRAFEEIVRSKGLADRVSRSVESSVCCISRRYYAHLFDQGATPWGRGVEN